MERLRDWPQGRGKPSMESPKSVRKAFGTERDPHVKSVHKMAKM